MPDPDPRIDPDTGRAWTPRKRLLRALARRFPAAHVAFNRLRGGSRHLLGGVWRRAASVGRTLRWSRQLWRDLQARRREPRLTVGVDVTPLWESLTGVGWYLYRLLEHLAGRTDLRVRLYGVSTVLSPDLERPTAPLPSGPALEEVTYRVPDDLLLPAGLLIRLLRRLEPLLLAADGNDVLFAPNYFLPQRFLFTSGARVVTVHDLGYRKVPWTLQEETLEELSRKLSSSLFAASRIISVSGAVRSELAELGYAPPERVTVIHHGPGQLAGVTPEPPEPGWPRVYGLHVGTLEPRKNILTLLEAWRILGRLVEDPPPLLLCGRFGWRSEEIRRGVEEAEAAGRVLHLGYVGEGQLATLYRGARVVLFPSLYEGFGLPAVEAQQAGAALVCSDLPVLREATEGKALFAPPERADLLAERVATLLTDRELRQDLVRQGLERAGRLSWTRAADLTAGVWYRAAARPTPGGYGS